MTDGTRCPVCQEAFGNPGALGTHLSLTKDASHVAHRAGAETPPPQPPALGEAAPASPVLLPALPAPAETPALPALPFPIGVPGEAGEAGTQGETRQDEARQAGDIPVLTLPPPSTVEPLLPPSDTPGQAGEARKAPPVSVPLEPILSGALAIGINGLVLNKPGDREITSTQVQGTGFPKSVEACLRLYFPDLPLDHPVVALIASGAGLAMLVVSLKAKPSKEGEAGEAPAQTQASPAPAAPAARGSTGDAYWDAILAKAGGVQA